MKVAREKNMSYPVNNEQLTYTVTTVEENQKGYTSRQFIDAKRARNLYHMLGAPSVDNFKKILRQNLIKNCPVTVEHINIAEKIFGPDIATQKGKSTRPKSPRIVDDQIEIPKEIMEKYNNLLLCIDNMFINQIPLFTSIDKTLRYRTLVPLEN